MTPILEAKKLLKDFVSNSQDCSIYVQGEQSKVCFGATKIVQILLNKNSISFKKYHIVNGKAEVKISKKISLSQAEMFTVKFHFKHTHQEKTLKSA